MTPIFKRMPGKVVVAVAISLLAGLYANDILDNARIFGLLPFFVLGLKMHEGHWNLLRTRRARGTASPCCSACSCSPGSPAAGSRPSGSTTAPATTPSTRQPARDRDPDVAAAHRPGRLVRVLRGGAARRKTWFSTLGAATLVVYLFHGFFVLGAEFAGFTGWAADHWPLVAGAGHGAGAAALAIFLAWQPVSSRLNVFVDPIGTFTRRRQRLAVKASRSGPQVGVTALNGTTSMLARPLTGGRVAAEVGGVPRWPPRRVAAGGAAAAAGPRAARSASCPSSWVHSVRSSPGATYNGAPKARSTRRPRVSRSAARGRPRRRSAASPRSRPAPRRAGLAGQATRRRASAAAPCRSSRSRPRGRRTRPHPASSCAARTEVGVRRRLPVRPGCAASGP